MNKQSDVIGVLALHMDSGQSRNWYVKKSVYDSLTSITNTLNYFVAEDGTAITFDRSKVELIEFIPPIEDK